MIKKWPTAIKKGKDDVVHYCNF